MGHSEYSPVREVHSNTCLPKKKKRNISNKQPGPTIKELENQQQTMPRESRRQEIIKIKGELMVQRIKQPFNGYINPVDGSLNQELVQ